MASDGECIEDVIDLTGATVETTIDMTLNSIGDSTDMNDGEIDLTGDDLDQTEGIQCLDVVEVLKVKPEPTPPVGTATIVKPEVASSKTPVGTATIVKTEVTSAKPPVGTPTISKTEVTSTPSIVKAQVTSPKPDGSDSSGESPVPRNQVPRLTPPPESTVRLINNSWPTRSDAVTAIKLESTKVGKQVVVGQSLSNGRKVTLVCSTYGKTTTSRFLCDYRAVLRKSKKDMPNPWRLKVGTKPKNLQHGKFCLSHAQITTKEALLMTVPYSNGRTSISINSTIKNICNTHKIPHAAVSKHVAQQVRLQHADQANKTYDVDWSKIHLWAESYTLQNDGSRYHIERDDSNRFVRMFMSFAVSKNVAMHTGECGNLEI